jgi:hypothetical protein
MKTLIAVAIAVLVVAPAGLAVGVAKDPRVPALQRRVAALERSMANHVEADAATFDQHQTQITTMDNREHCYWARQWNENYRLDDNTRVLFNLPKNNYPHISDNGACAAVGLPPARKTQSLR